MRVAVLALVVAAAAFAPGLAAAQSDDEFPLKRRQFFPLRDVNAAEYEPDFAWQRLSETERQRASGIDFGYGSLSERRLGIERRLQLNTPLVEGWLHFRWQHEMVANEEIEAGSEKIELQLGRPGSVAFTLSGNGVLEKRDASFGAGILWASVSRTRYLDLTIQHDAPVHDARTPFDAKDEVPPLRLLGETSVHAGPARVYGFADWQLDDRRVFATPRGSGGVRSRSDYTRRTELKVEWHDIGIRHRFSGQGDERRHFTGYVDPEKNLVDYEADRSHHRVDVFGEHRAEDLPLRVRGVAGFWIQEDAADFSFGQDYAYRRTQFLFGTRAHWSLTPEIELGVGYWGNVMTAERDADGESTSRSQTSRATFRAAYYVDKGDVVFTYAFDATKRLELLVSQEITRGEFGGGCGKALILF